MSPTCDFRYLMFQGSTMKHPTAKIWAGNQLIVLQQKWVSDYDGEGDEWRDIPIINPSDDKGER